ncbi:uncharacterized protein LOC135377458 [Ornithodoros turicata]|uniref:uncharacterized protein LOC135377458 n=1 Tax=Ornithodoros turicata TaxID=34597 RepID=UPI00313959F1
MVLAFVILSTPVRTSGVIFSSFYGFTKKKSDCSRSNELTDSDELNTSRGPSELHEDHKTTSDFLKRIHQYVMEEVLSQLNTGLSPRPTTDHGTVFVERTGIFPLNDIDVPGGVVLWHAVNDTCFVMVCKGKENITLAQQVHRYIVHSICSHIPTVLPFELMSKVGLLHAILNQHIPNGRLMCINHSVAKQHEQLLQKFPS